MASRYEVEVTIDSARDLKNINWRYGPIKPYAVVWIDPAAKCSTKADLDGDTNPTWDDKLTVPLPVDRPLDDAVLHIDIVHAGPADGVKPLIGSAKLPLREVLDEAGMGGKCIRTLKLKRPSGRPHGKLDVKVKVAPRDQPRYNDPYAPSYGQGTRDPYGGGYAAPPPSGYPTPAPYGAPQPGYAGYGADAGYGAAQSAYGQTGYAAAQPAYGQPAAAYGGYGDAPSAYSKEGYGAGGSYGAAPVVVEEKKKGKFGMGTGLALGAAGGLLGGLAIYEGAEYVEDKFDDEVDEKVDERVEEQNYDDDY